MSFRPRLTSLFVIALVIGVTATVRAQSDPKPSNAHPSAAGRPAGGLPRLPADSVTQQTVKLPGRALAFKATAGTIKLSNGDTGVELADVAYVAFQLDHADNAKRPITFVFNGGPGAGSAWLDLGALGPWRLPLNNGVVHPSSPPALIDNADTWLDFTDLVFIDPPGTGYSQIVGGEDARKELYSLRGDIEALAVVIRKWLTANDRLVSPKFLVGESYGGFRAPALAEKLTTEQGIGVSGLVLISPVLDFRAMSSPNEALTWAIRLPSFAAVAREKNGLVTEAQLADVERYAAGDYLQDFMRGPNDPAAIARMVDRVATFTGLDRELVERMHGRIDKETFLREFDRAHGKIGAFYDATVRAYEPSPEASDDHWLDPIVPGFEPPLTSAMVWLYQNRLGWKIDNKYQLLNDAVAHAWDYGHDRNELNNIPPLKRMLALDPNFRVLVAQGLTDVQVPYFGTKLLLAQIPDYGPPGRVSFKTYGGGHMLYTRDASRRALRDDARTLIEGK
jgi:carboxypeptidase C (cathepsin A)